MESGTTMQYESNELEHIQKEAARIVTGATRHVSINSFLTEIEWGNSFYSFCFSRMNKHELTLFYLYFVNFR